MLPLSELPLCLGLPQHSNQYSPERPVLLAVDQELGDNRVRPSVAAAGRLGRLTFTTRVDASAAPPPTRPRRTLHPDAREADRGPDEVARI
jgi:hypothetical protein